MPYVFVLALVNLYMIVLSVQHWYIKCSIAVLLWLVYIFDKKCFYSVLIANLKMLVPVFNNIRGLLFTGLGSEMPGS